MHLQGATPRALSRRAASESLALAGTFLESFTDAHPEVEVETFDLWDGSLPDFGPAATAPKMPSSPALGTAPGG